LVTGGAGFIGSHVVEELLAEGIDVTVLDSLAPQAHAVRPNYLREADVRYVFDDVRDADSVQRALAQCDGVAHLASKVGLGVDLGDVSEYVSHNDLGTAALITAMRASAFEGPVALASSMVVYGEGRYRCADHGVVRPGPRTVEALDAGNFEPPCPACGADLTPEPVPESAPLEPRNVYAATKLHQEHLFEAWQRETDLPVLAFRYHNVYGPRMPRNTPYAGVASIIRSALEDGRAPQVYEDGAQRRDFVHVTDIARATISPFVRPEAPSGAYNIGSGAPHTVGQMATALSEAFSHAGGAITPEVTGQYRLGDVRHVFASIDRARTSLAYEPATTFADGIQAFATAPLREPLGAPLREPRPHPTAGAGHQREREEEDPSSIPG